MRHSAQPPGRIRLALCALLLLMAGCALDGKRERRGPQPAPIVDRVAQQTAAIAGFLETLQHLVMAKPAEQAEIVARAQRNALTDPTAANQLRYALVLATPGHASSDYSTAYQQLREIVAQPQSLVPAERAIAFLQLQQLERQLALGADNRRLQNELDRGDRERLAALNRRLQAEIDENARLKKALEEARAKLEAIADIERASTERKPPPEGRSP